MHLNQNNNGQNTCGQASGQPTRLLHADGYVDVSAQVPVFYYHLKDHLGNVRLVITPAGSSNQPEIVQAMEYYPFGMRFESSIPYESDHSHMPNKHTYNSNEEQEMPGRWLDYGFRFYDSQIARFHSVDPLAHSFSSQSPYVYAGNNPILNIDFMGLSAMSNVSNKRTSSFTLEMTDEDFIKATRPIGLEGVESKEKKKKTDKNTESQTSQQNGNGKKKDGKNKTGRKFYDEIGNLLADENIRGKETQIIVIPAVVIKDFFKTLAYAKQFGNFADFNHVVSRFGIEYNYLISGNQLFVNEKLSIKDNFLMAAHFAGEGFVASFMARKLTLDPNTNQPNQGLVQHYQSLFTAKDYWLQRTRFISFKPWW